MQVVYERCAGLDVHKESVVVCLITPDATGRPHKQLRTFGTHTPDLERLRAWLVAAACQHAAMESTGVYWVPVFNVLEGACGLDVVNAAHIKAVPGRKTDVKDAEWLADLLRHGLLRGSFVPGAEQRALRDLTRYRTSLLNERSRAVNRVQKVLEEANIKLGSVLSDVLGKSGRAMVEGLLAPDPDPALLATLADPHVRASQEELVAALTGKVQAHHRFLLRELLTHIDNLNASIGRLNEEIAARLAPFEQELVQLDTIPGVNRRVAEVLMAEFGMAVERFANAGQLASWAGMCPGNNESAGKQHNGKTRKGNRWLKQILVEAANGAARSKETYLRAQYGRLVARRGRKKAMVAVGHSILVIAYQILTRQEEYRELGADYFTRRNKEVVKRRAIRELERLGLHVTIEEVPTAA